MYANIMEIFFSQIYIPKNVECIAICLFSGNPVNVLVTLEREDEITGPVIAPFFPQVNINQSMIGVIQTHASISAKPQGIDPHDHIAGLWPVTHAFSESYFINNLRLQKW